MLDINLLGLLRPGFAVVFCFPSLAPVVAVVLLEYGGCDFSLETLDDTPKLFAGGFN